MKTIVNVLASFAIILGTPYQEKTMSDEAQEAILEACEWWPEPTSNMFTDWQEAVLEATED